MKLSEPDALTIAQEAEAELKSIFDDLFARQLKEQQESLSREVRGSVEAMGKAVQTLDRNFKDIVQGPIDRLNDNVSSRLKGVDTIRPRLRRAELGFSVVIVLQVIQLAVMIWWIAGHG